ncbi:hypothetical protein BOA8489_00127 [Boseongicola aestuarii]|uniref:Uncharacterized protein n=1 Tax=Boseongicola aestuarii TaxID=1470561 RepID=A0A238IWD2_9RHOB|nr:hypothetical protein BOA8489_00127 [Boseongicola aestuarii]
MWQNVGGEFLPLRGVPEGGRRLIHRKTAESCLPHRCEQDDSRHFFENPDAVSDCLSLINQQSFEYHPVVSHLAVGRIVKSSIRGR